MIEIEEQPWRQMVAHARATYPNECCGAMLGAAADSHKRVSNCYAARECLGGPAARQIRTCGPRICCMPIAKPARQNMDLVGIYHSHPDCDAYFSETDLKNSCPWYSFVVLSIQKGEFDHANSWLPNAEQTAARKRGRTVDG